MNTLLLSFLSLNIQLNIEALCTHTHILISNNDSRGPVLLYLQSVSFSSTASLVNKSRVDCTSSPSPWPSLSRSLSDVGP